MSRFIRMLPAFVAAAILSAPLTGCSRVERARRTLDDEDPVLRAAAAESLGLWRATDAARDIHPLLHDRYAGVRERSAQALARLRDSTAFRDLLELVRTDADAGVRAIAARALAELMQDTTAGELIGLLDSPTTAAKLHAAQGLTELIRASGDRLRTPTGIKVGWALGGVVESGQAAREELPGNWQVWDDYLSGVIASEDTGEVLADQAAVGLAWLGGEGAGRGLVLALRGTLSPTLRDSLLSILVATGDTLVTKRLIADCRTRIVSARKRAVHLLGGLPNTLVFDALLEASSDPAIEVRREAWQSLLRLHGLRLPGTDVSIPTRHFAAISPALIARAKESLRDGDPRIWRSAALVLVNAGDARAVEVLLKRGRSEPVWVGMTLDILAEVPESIGGGAPDGVRPLVEWGISSRGPDDRIGAARALGRWETENAAQVLTRLIDDPRAEVVVAALEAVARRHLTALLADVLPLFGADSTIQAQAARTAAALVDVQSFNYLILALTTDQLQRRRGAVMAVRLVAERVHHTEVVVAALQGVARGRQTELLADVLSLFGADSTVAQAARTAAALLDTQSFNQLILALTDEAKAYGPQLSRAGSWLARMAQEESEPGDRANALAALSYTPAEEVEETLGFALGDPSELVRATAAVAMARLRPELSIPSLRKIALGGSDRHRMQVIRTLGELTITEARDVLRIVSVVDPAPEIRWHARTLLSSPVREPV